MKTSTSAVLSAALVFFSGCNQGTPGGNTAAPDTTTTRTGTNGVNGTTTTTHSNNADSSSETHSVSKPLIGEKEETFSLDLPNLSTGIKQGETQNITIGIDRGQNFDEDVTLSLSNLPAGLTITPEKPVLKKGEEEVIISVAAAADAALGDFTVTVSGSPSGGGTTATNQLELTVKEQ